MPAEMRKVQVGETEYVLRPFKAFKALVAGDLISRVGNEIRELMGSLREFDREYGKTNLVRFTKAQTIQRGWSVPDGAFVRRDGEEPYIDLPGVPTAEERMMFAFPAAFKLAKSEVQKLLALIVISNDDLRNGDINGDLDERLEKIGQEIVYGGDVGEVVELISAAIEHAQDQLRAHEGAVGKLRAFWKSMMAPAESTETEERKTTIEPMRVVEEDEAGSDPSPESSTPSPTPTAGNETTSSTVPTGASFSPSAS